MLERIRKRLTLGYVGIFALILLFIGIVAVVSFAQQAAGQQDELLEQTAQGNADYVANRLLRDYQEGETPGEPGIGPFQWANDPEIGSVALVPPGEAGGDATVLDSTSSAPSFGLPFVGPAEEATQRGETVHTTEDGPGGEKVRVASLPVSGNQAMKYFRYTCVSFS